MQNITWKYTAKMGKHSEMSGWQVVEHATITTLEAAELEARTKIAADLLKCDGVYKLSPDSVNVTPKYPEALPVFV